MSESEGRTSEASRITAAYADTRMEVGQAWHGFYHWITQDPIGIGFYLGSSGSLDQSSSLYPSEDHLYKRELAKIYRIVCLHGVPRTIVSDRGTQFTLKFWHQLH